MSGVPYALTAMTKGKIVAIMTGAISILIAVAYLVLVFILDSRGEMKPAPISQTPSTFQVVEQLGCISSTWEK